MLLLFRLILNNSLSASYVERVKIFEFKLERKLVLYLSRVFFVISCSLASLFLDEIRCSYQEVFSNSSFSNHFSNLKATSCLIMSAAVFILKSLGFSPGLQINIVFRYPV